MLVAEAYNVGDLHKENLLFTSNLDTSLYLPYVCDLGQGIYLLSLFNFTSTYI